MHILLADDQAKVRSAMRLLFEQDPDIEVMGEAVDARGLLDWLEIVCPDMILLDWELPGGSGEELLSAARANCSRVAIVALSGRPEARPAALDAGADAFVSKGDPPERLLETIEACVEARAAAAPADARPAERATTTVPGGDHRARPDQETLQ
jgi:DNA-binding NarL/FixJ family response regulator